MRPLTLDDLLPLEEYANRRREFFESHARYLDRYRRVRIGPSVTLLFENRQTLWFRVQELLRIARLAEAERVQQELDVYNRLLPAKDRLQASLLIDVPDGIPLTQTLSSWQDFRGEELRFCLDKLAVPGGLVTCRPEDRIIGAAHWVQFLVDEESRRLLADWHRPAHLELVHRSYEHQSAPLSEDVRQGLLDDLASSDRDR